METKDFLRQTPILQGLDEGELNRFLAIARRIEVPKGQVILREGDSGDTLYILEKGTVDVSKTLVIRPKGEEPSGRDKILTKLSSEDRAIFGEMAWFEQSQRTATVVAITDCTLLEIAKGDFFRLAEENARLGYKVTRNIAELLCSRLRKTGEDVIKLTTALSIALSR